jgi:hypothetical protein
MPSLLKFALASALAVATNAVPVEQASNAKHSFTIHQSANPHFKLNGAGQLVKALRKFGAQERATEIVKKTTSGSVVAQPADQYDSYVNASARSR